MSRWAPALLLALALFLAPHSTSAQADPLSARQEIIETLNRQFDCNLTAYSPGERLTFTRTLSRPSCKIKPDNYREASQLLESLAVMSPPDEAADFHKEAKRFDEAGPILEHLIVAERQLWRDGTETPQGLEHIGHPFESIDHTEELEDYQRTAGALESLHLACERPACDPFLWREAKAVTDKPVSSAGRQGSTPVAPNSSDLSYFAQRYQSDGEIRRALGLTSEWMWNTQNFSSHLRTVDDTLIFPHLLPKMEFTIGEWDSTTEYPAVLPLFLLFQEACRLKDYLQTLPQRDALDHLREIRVEGYQAGQPLVVLETVIGDYRLKIRALHPPDSLGGKDAVRSALYAQVAKAFADASQLSASLAAKPLRGK